MSSIATLFNKHLMGSFQPSSISWYHYCISSLPQGKPHSVFWSLLALSLSAYPTTLFLSLAFISPCSNQWTLVTLFVSQLFLTCAKKPLVSPMTPNKSRLMCLNPSEMPLITSFSPWSQRALHPLVLLRVWSSESSISSISRTSSPLPVTYEK